MTSVQETNASVPVDRRDHVQSIERAFTILQCFGTTTPTLSLSEVAKQANFDRATARRYLLTLERLGYVGRTEQRYHLRSRILELGYSYLSSIPLPRLAQPHLTALCAHLNESCAITVLDGSEIAYIAVENTPRGLAINLAVGNRLPAYCTAMGRVLLSGMTDDAARDLLDHMDHAAQTATTVFDTEAILDLLEQVRSQGWTVVDQELEQGVRTVAVPIHDQRGNIVAAASVSVPASRISINRLKDDIRGALHATVTEIESSLTRIHI